MVLVVTLTALIKSTGHGNFMDLGSWDKPTDPETLEFLIAPLREVLSGYWYDFTGLAVIGLLGSIPYAVAIYKLSIKASVIILAGGALKSVAYAIGWVTSTQYPTEVGELLTGLFVGISLYLSMKLTRREQ